MTERVPPPPPPQPARASMAIIGKVAVVVAQTRIFIVVSPRVDTIQCATPMVM